MTAIIHRVNKGAMVRGVADSGLFLDHISDYRTPLTHMPFGRDEASVNNILDYSSAMKDVFKFANMSSGSHPSCIKHYSTSSKNINSSLNSIANCIFAQNLIPFIETPVFALQVK